MHTKNLTIQDVVRMSAEEIAGKDEHEKQELYDVVSKSQAKAGIKKAQLIADLMEKQKKGKQARKNKKENKPEPVENSTKTPEKPKQKKAPAKKKEPEQEAPKEEKPKQKKKKTVKVKKPDLSDLPEETRKYIEELEAKAEKFPDTITQGNQTFRKQEVNSAEEFRDMLLEHPYQVRVFINEKIDEDLTDTLALVCNKEVTILFDKSREKNHVLNLKTENVDFEENVIHPEKKNNNLLADFHVYLQELPEEEE